MRRAVFFDRDGVINVPVVRDGRPYPPRHAGELHWMAGVHDTLRTLRERGFLLFVVTNQPDVARGTTARSDVEEIHRRMIAELPIERVYTCYHDDADACECRKPKPGMILQGSRDYAVDLSRSWLVGDRWRDIDAGRAAGCRTILLQHDYAERPATDFDARVDQLSGILEWIRE
jgi:D-glycero-D-manno-heptose 1,7-bisphosphate phosphatase